MIAARLIGRVAVWAAVCAGAAVVGLPDVEPLVSGGSLGIAAGALAGAALVAALARRSLSFLRVPFTARTLSRSAYLAGRSVYEEVLWRGAACGGLTPFLGIGPALALTTVGFALAHVGAQGRGAAVHLFTGLMFGGVFLAFGLASSIVAHATYNVLVGLAADAARTRASPVLRPLATG